MSSYKSKNYHIEGNFGNEKIWQMQHVNIFGGVKFGKLVKPVCTSSCLHAFVMQTNIWSYRIYGGKV